MPQVDNELTLGRKLHSDINQNMALRSSYFKDETIVDMFMCCFKKNKDKHVYKKRIC